jgi:YVTN family beta-propeller protein
MRGKVISSASVFSVVLCTILTLSAIYSGIGTAKADSVIATIPVGAEPFVVAVNANTGNVYVGSDPSNTVTVISSGNHVIAIIHVGVTPRKIAVNPNTGNVYVANAGSNTVSVISASNQVIATIPVGTVPGGIALNPNTGNVYVTNAGNGNANEVNFNTVSVISGSTNQVIATIPVGMAHLKSLLTLILAMYM